MDKINILKNIIKKMEIVKNNKKTFRYKIINVVVIMMKIVFRTINIIFNIIKLLLLF